MQSCQECAGSGITREDFSMRMVELVNQRRNILQKGHGRLFSAWKNLSFEEVKEEFDKLVKQVESFAPINFEATKDSLEKIGERPSTKTSKEPDEVMKQKMMSLPRRLLARCDPILRIVMMTRLDPIGVLRSTMNHKLEIFTTCGVNTPGSDENSLKLYDLIADMKGC
ncbi:hypothetical protein Tco_0407397 [Tanacetum coccineum]